MASSSELLFGDEVSGPDIHADYKIDEEPIGSGNFSVVKKAVHRISGEVVAVKIIDKSNLDVNPESLRQEVNILKQVKFGKEKKSVDGGLLVYVKVFDRATHFALMKRLTGGELFDRIVDKYPNGYSEQIAAEVIRKIAEAVQYLHKKGIVHRDLKPENLLYLSPDNDSEIKITDFGLAKLQKQDSMLKTACGTPNYVAPEVILGMEYDDQVDMWSIGVILYILLCGFPPFYHQDTSELFEQIIAGKFTFPSPYWDHISNSAKDLIQRLLQVDPRDRYTAAECLAHPWVKGTTAREDIMQGVVGELKSYNARRRWRMALDAVEFVVKLAKAMQRRGGSSSSK